MIEFLECLIYQLKHRKVLMSQVQFSATFEVTEQSTPLTVTPPSADFKLNVGIPVDGTPVCQVSGGVAPYTYALDPASSALPTGIQFAEDGNGNVTLQGTPMVAGASSSPVLLNITDAAGASAQVQAQVKTI